MNAANWIGVAMLVGAFLILYVGMGLYIGSFRQVTVVFVAGITLAALIIVGISLTTRGCVTLPNKPCSPTITPGK